MHPTDWSKKRLRQMVPASDDSPFAVRITGVLPDDGLMETTIDAPLLRVESITMLGCRW